jgi:predicted GH43/DUF377 family glycosyl hydrolase
LLDAGNPASVLGRTDRPILTPTEAFECSAFVPEVVFPTGIVERGDELLIYYGAGDANTAVVSLPRDEILRQLSPPLN